MGAVKGLGGLLLGRLATWKACYLEGLQEERRMSGAADDQAEVLAFLADPAAYGAPGTAVRRIDTHAASVFLAGDRALKVKRAVRFPFLDYSSLHKRKQAC